MGEVTHRADLLGRLISKLNRLYSTNIRGKEMHYTPGLCGPYFMFDDLFDYMKDKGFDIQVELSSPESTDLWKKLMWQYCKGAAKKEAIYKQTKTGKEATKEEILNKATKLYKSEIVVRYLVEKWNEGYVFKITPEEPVPVLIDKKFEKKVQEYLTLKIGTIELALLT